MAVTESSYRMFSDVDAETIERTLQETVDDYHAMIGLLRETLENDVWTGEETDWHRKAKELLERHDRRKQRGKANVTFSGR